MSRGQGAKSKTKGRISGYETADFSIVSTTTMDSEKTSSIYREKKKMRPFKKVGIVLICIAVITIISLSIIGAIVSSNESVYEEPKIITPESCSIKPTAFTQRQLDAEYARDKKIGKLLEKEWTMTDNARPSNYFITVGKKWQATSSNQSPILEVSTSHEYDPKEQKYETSSIKICLQELKGNGGIIVDSTVANILNIYNPSINIDSIKSSVQAAYNSNVNSKPYEGTLTFDRDRVYIRGGKSGRLINVTIEVNTSISIN